ncbi:kelch 24, partial [Sigmodon hispidus]
IMTGLKLLRNGSGDRGPGTKCKAFDMDFRSLTGREYFDFSSAPSHAEDILRVFNEFREKQLLTDVILCVEGQEFPCHRAVLSASSSYFRAMFCNDHRERRETLIEINGIFAKAMEYFLQLLKMYA